MELQSIEIFIKYLKNIRERTLRVINEIPDSRLDWKPHPSAFSFADLIRHLASIQYNMFGRNIQNLISSYPGHGSAIGTTKSEILNYMSTDFNKLVNTIESMTIENLQEKCETPAGTPITKWKWLRSMIEHEIHHRGQIFTYLKLLEYETTPLYGLTSEEVKDNSISITEN